MNKVVGLLAVFATKFHIYDLCLRFGIAGLGYRIFCRNIIKKSEDFFNENKERIENNCSLLADEKSVRVYRDAIKYRIKRYRHDHPQFNPDDQYFPEDIIILSDNEVFIDCGAYTGDTFDDFIKFERRCTCGGGSYKYIAFEPEERLYNELISKCSDKCFVAHKCGVWKNSGTLKFYSGDMAMAAEAKYDYAKYEGDFTEVEVKAIDESEECQDATFIKMDIEGSEMEALLGAEKVIRRNKPKLAICIYHSDEDMLRIIEYIHSIVPEYKLYVRHHSAYVAETVLYAI